MYSGVPNMLSEICTLFAVLGPSFHTVIVKLAFSPIFSVVFVFCVIFMCMS